MVSQSAAPSHRPTEVALNPEAPVHFIGIGGIGMNGLARILAQSGYRVSGSDASENPRIDALREQGVIVHTGEHRGENVPSGAIVVCSTAIQESNPERQAAVEQHLPLVHRSDILRAILEGREFGFHNTIGLTGTHGKTTLTGMAGVSLTAAGMDPTVIAGGLIPGEGHTVRTGPSRDWAIAELDESDGTVTRYNPTISVIANLEWDHADHFPGGLDDLRTLFKTFLSGLAPTAEETVDKAVLLNVDCPNTAALREFVPANVVMVPIAYERHTQTGVEPEYWVEDIVLNKELGGYGGTVVHTGQPLVRLNMQAPGWHNLFNAMVTIVVGHRMGANLETMAHALGQFVGMGRRFEPVGRLNGALLVDDYAHHPTEVRATLKAGVERLGKRGALTAIFQPHRYSRLQALWQEFVHSFVGADFLIVTDVYGAGEDPIEGSTARDFFKAVAAQGVLRPDKMRYFSRDEWPELGKFLMDHVKENDVVMTLGAGDVTQFLRKHPYREPLNPGAPDAGETHP